MDIIGRLWALLTSDETQGENQPLDTNDEESASSRNATRGQTRLYHCAACGTTFIATELDSCPDCQAPVEGVPDEHDLGLG